MNEACTQPAKRTLCSLGSFLKDELQGLLDLLFPSACSLCGKSLQSSRQPTLCGDCLEEFALFEGPRCTRCALPFPDFGGEDHLCGQCLRQPPPFSGVTALGIHEGLLRQAIHRFKYEGAIHLARPLGNLLASALTAAGSAAHYDLLVPVPLHPQRLRKRTYNQALLIAQVLAAKWKTPVEKRLLRRGLPTKAQQGLSLAARMKNLSGAFDLKAPLSGKKILLIDDVMTTGATVSECAASLCAGGASTVHVAVLARARKNR